MHGRFYLFFVFVFHQLFALVIGLLITSASDHYRKKRIGMFVNAPEYIFGMANDLASIDV